MKISINLQSNNNKTQYHKKKKKTYKVVDTYFRNKVIIIVAKNIPIRRLQIPYYIHPIGTILL